MIAFTFSVCLIRDRPVSVWFPDLSNDFPLALYTAKTVNCRWEGHTPMIWYLEIPIFFKKKKPSESSRSLFFLGAPVGSESKQRLTEAVVLCSVVVFFVWRANSHTSGESETGPARFFRYVVSHTERDLPAPPQCCVTVLLHCFLFFWTRMASSWSDVKRKTGFPTCSTMWLIFPWKRKWCRLYSH